MIKITCRDGRMVFCKEEDRFEVFNHHWRNIKYKNFSVEEIDNFIKTRVGGLYLPIYVDMKLGNDVPMSPYVLGVLLGDGCLTQSSIEISTADQDILDNIINDVGGGFRISKKSDKYGYRLVHTNVQKGSPNTVKNTLVDIGAWGLKASEKHIPDVFKTASYKNRMLLLQGLMDTDGTIISTNKVIRFVSISEQLAKDVSFLVMSLGGIASIRCEKRKEYSDFGEYQSKATTEFAYVVHISHKSPDILFRLIRKRNLACQKSKFQKHDKIRIMDVEQIGSIPNNINLPLILGNNKNATIQAN